MSDILGFVPERHVFGVRLSQIIIKKKEDVVEKELLQYA